MRPAKKGEVRNPTGKNGFSDEWRGMLKKACTEQDMIAIADKMIALAKAGNTDAAKFILEKSYPKVDKPIKIDLTVEDARDYLIEKLTGYAKPDTDQ